MQIELLKGIPYKHSEKLFFCDNVHSHVDQLSELRSNYERIRPRLLFLAENEPDSSEYKELYEYAMNILGAVEEIIGPIHK